MVGINWDLKLEHFQGDPDLVKCNSSENRKKINSKIHKLQISDPTTKVLHHYSQYKGYCILRVSCRSNTHQQYTLYQGRWQW